MLLRLPDGHYQVTARYDGSTVHRTVMPQRRHARSRNARMADLPPPVRDRRVQARMAAARRRRTIKNECVHGST